MAPPPPPRLFFSVAPVTTRLAVLESVHEDPKYARRQVVMGRDERGLLGGWHGIESDAGTTYRWSDRDARASLRVTGGAVAVVASTAFPDRQQQLIVRANGQTLGVQPLDHEWRTLEFPASHVRADREVDISLNVSMELPKSIKGADQRYLGARVARISGG